MAVSIDDLGRPKDGDELIVCAMHVPHRDHALDAVDVARIKTRLDGRPSRGGHCQRRHSRREDRQEQASGKAYHDGAGGTAEAKVFHVTRQILGRRPAFPGSRTSRGSSV